MCLCPSFYRCTEKVLIIGNHQRSNLVSEVASPDVRPTSGPRISSYGRVGRVTNGAYYVLYKEFTVDTRILWKPTTVTGTNPHS